MGTGEAQVKPGFTTPKQKITRARSAIVSDKQITPNQAIETSKRKLTTSNKSREENKSSKKNSWNNAENVEFKLAATVLFKDKDENKMTTNSISNDKTTDKKDSKTSLKYI